MLGDMKGKIAAGKLSTIGVTVTGAVVATAIGKQHTYDEAVWHDINSVSVGSSFTVGLKNNGRVVSTDDGSNVHGASTVSNWSDIVGIAAGNYTFGLKKGKMIKNTKKGESTKHTNPTSIYDWGNTQFC